MDRRSSRSVAAALHPSLTPGDEAAPLFARMKKDAVLSKIRAEKVIALIRADSPDGLLDCAKALAAGGLTSIELTMTTPGAIRMLEKATVELPDFIFGLGTVLDAETARTGILAGAKFVVTPGVRLE